MEENKRRDVGLCGSVSYNSVYLELIVTIHGLGMICFEMFLFDRGRHMYGVMNDLG